MDEYCDWQGRAVPVDHTRSVFRGYIRRTLFDQLDLELRIPDEQIHFPDPLNIRLISQRIEAVGASILVMAGLATTATWLLTSRLFRAGTN